MLRTSAVDVNHEGPIAALEGIHVHGDGGAPILRGVDLIVQQGERVLITGPSGSGKSTILRTLTGIEHPERVTAGTVRLFGRNIYDLSDKARARLLAAHVGLGFQSPELDTNFTVRDNLLGIHELLRSGNPPIERLARLVTLFGIADELLDRRAEALSGGEKQRVAMVRALLPLPELVVLDEPTHMLDVPTKAQVCEFLTDIAARKNITLIVVSHDEEARSMATRQIEVSNGTVVDSAS